VIAARAKPANQLFPVRRIGDITKGEGKGLMEACVAERYISATIPRGNGLSSVPGLKRQIARDQPRSSGAKKKLLYEDRRKSLPVYRLNKSAQPAVGGEIKTRRKGGLMTRGGSARNIATFNLGIGVQRGGYVSKKKKRICARGSRNARDVKDVLPTRRRRAVTSSERGGKKRRGITREGGGRAI